MYSNPNGLFNLTVPDKKFRNSNYQQLTYAQWKLAQLREAANAGEDVGDEEIITKDWEKDALTSSAILKVNVKSKANMMIRVGIKFSVEDNEKKNVEFPLTMMKENLFSRDTKQAFVFTKIDPSKESWGDISIEVSEKENKTTQISTSTGTSYSTGGYSTGQQY